METNISTYQAKLLSDLSKEFDKLNPKIKVGITPKFSLKTINHCINEEKTFIETIAKYNVSIAQVLDKQFKAEIKAFEKEYKKVMYITFGKRYSETNISGTYDTMFKSSNNCGGSRETEINFVSEVKRNTNSDTQRYNEGQAYHTIYCSYKTERAPITLQSGKRIELQRIVGFNFSTHDWLHKNNEYATNRNTLDSLIQESKDVQQRIVYICQ